MTQFALKLLALICMLCDHVAKVVLPTGVLIPVLGIQGDLFLRTFLEIVGRMAFPIFAWFTAEACRKTKHAGAYLLRLAVFAFLSEIPFQLCFYGAYSYGFQFCCHNVIYTMLLSALAIFASENLKQRKVPEVIAELIPAAIAIALGWLLYTDYNAWGVALILLLYYLPEEKGKLAAVACWITLFQLVWHGWNGSGFMWLQRESSAELILKWIGGMMSVPFLAAYNGKKGRGMKYLFYIFYPSHLALLFLLRLLCLS